MFRLDHFRGFVGYWEVHSSEKTAINGKWVKAPAKDFFTTLLKHFPDISIIAEDLGVITPDVKELMHDSHMDVRYYASEEDVDFVLSAVEFVADHGVDFLPLYRMGWRDGVWRAPKTTSRGCLLVDGEMVFERYARDALEPG